MDRFYDIKSSESLKIIKYGGNANTYRVYQFLAQGTCLSIKDTLLNSLKYII